MRGHVDLNTVRDPRRQIWAVNEDPEKLDRVLERLLGRETTRLLPEETKWLAVTHKSFDYGRRGFNTRLAFYGAFNAPVMDLLPQPRGTASISIHGSEN